MTLQRKDFTSDRYMSEPTREKEREISYSDNSLLLKGNFPDILLIPSCLTVDGFCCFLVAVKSTGDEAIIILIYTTNK